ncbi:MAG TPA: hypothetical protein PL041_03700 [Melioribacteraceae bacterium]|nr:hypothetical protein [Melioribacteraceae bacterium]
MEIKFETSSEFDNILNIMNYFTDNEGEDFNIKITQIAKAAFGEYLDMIVNNGMPSRLVDVQYLRISKLIKFYFGEFPTETQLSKIMHITNSKAKTLLNNYKSIYANNVSDLLNIKIIKILESCTRIEDDYECIINSNLILQHINEYITEKHPGLKKITKKEDTSGKYIIYEDTFSQLCKDYNIK